MEFGEPGLPAIQNLIQFLDAGGAQESVRSAEVSERVFEALRVRLSSVLGAGGYATLLARTLALTRAGFPWLAGVAADKSGSLAGRFGTAVQELSPEEAARGFAELLTRFGTLLVIFIGTDITNRLLWDAWQDLDSGDRNEIIVGERK